MTATTTNLKTMATPSAKHLPAAHTLVRSASHRSREKAETICGHRLQQFFSWQTACTGGFLAVPDQLLPAVLAVTGCTKASPRFTYQPCLQWK